MAELADALGSGPNGRKPLKVQILSVAPDCKSPDHGFKTTGLVFLFKKCLQKLKNSLKFKKLAWGEIMFLNRKTKQKPEILVKQKFNQNDTLKQSVILIGENNENKHILAKKLAEKHSFLYINLDTACVCEMDENKIKNEYNFYKNNLKELKSIDCRPSIERRFSEFAKISLEELNFRQAFPNIKNIYGLGFKSKVYDELSALSPLCGSLYKQFCINTIIADITKNLQAPCVLDVNIEKNLCHEISQQEIQTITEIYQQQFAGLEQIDHACKNFGENLRQMTTHQNESTKMVENLKKFGTIISIECTKNTNNQQQKFCEKIAKGNVICADFVKERTHLVTFNYGKSEAKKVEQTYTTVDENLLKEVLDIAEVYILNDTTTPTSHNTTFKTSA